MDAVSTFVMNVRVEGDKFFPDPHLQFMTLAPTEVDAGVKKLLRQLPETLLTAHYFKKFLRVKGGLGNDHRNY